MILLTCLLLIVAMMLAGLPVVFAFTLGGMLMAYLMDVDLAMLMPAAVRSIDSFTLLALPMFILLGALMRDSELSVRLIGLSRALVGRFRSGLGAVTILTCAVFGAISGSAAAAITSIGAFMLPELEKEGYPRGYATGLIAASSLLCLLIPPSIPMIVFAMAAQISIKEAFLSTVVPALILIVLYTAINAFCARRFFRDRPAAAAVPLRRQAGEIGHQFRRASFSLLLPVVVLGGIYAGIFTATEAAAIGCVMTLLIGFGIHRRLNGGLLYRSLWESMLLAGAVVVLLFVIIIMSRVMVLDGMPQKLAAVLLGFSEERWVALLLMNALLLVLGMLVDDISGNILSATLVLPAAVSLGIDPVHFAAISVVNLSVGNLTPPVAPMLYLAGMVGRRRLPLSEFIGPTLIFIVFGALPVMFAVTFIPSLSLGLVELLR